MNRMKVARLLLLAPLLGACGWIPLPEQRAEDVNFSFSGIPFAPGQVAYLPGNLAASLGRLPLGLPVRNVSVDADLTYRANLSASPVHFELFAVARLPACRTFTIASGLSTLLCLGPSGGRFVGEVVMQPGQTVHVRLKDQVFAAAARNQTLYMGVRILDGITGPNEFFTASNIRFNARF